jgi:hypothetical protein
MEVTEKEDGDSSINCTEPTANSEKLNINVKSSFKYLNNFKKSYFSCKERNYSGFNHCSGFNHYSRFNSRFNLITNLTISKVTSYDSNKQNIASSVISCRMRGVMGWQQKI